MHEIFFPEIFIRFFIFSLLKRKLQSDLSNWLIKLLQKSWLQIICHLLLARPVKEQVQQCHLSNPSTGCSSDLVWVI